MQSNKKKKFQVGCQLNYSLTDASTFIFNICAVNQNSQKVLKENLHIDPSCNFEEYIAPIVNNRYLRINVPEGNLKLSYQATVEICYVEENVNVIPENTPAELPLETLYYLYPSRYCQSDRLITLAQKLFGDLVPDYSRVTAICNWIYENVDYIAGSTDSQTSAYDTVVERAGVCRDFAHLAIAFCRALNIPARFVSAYAYNLNPPDFHACFEAYLGNRWYLFDPTRLVYPHGLIRIGTGKDAADVSFATIFGSAQLEQMNLFVESLDNNFLTETNDAISVCL